MTLEIGLLLGLLLAATVAFIFEWLRVDAVTLLLLVGLVAAGILSPEEAFAGFANPILVILASIFVISDGLARTHVLEGLTLTLAKIGGGSGSRNLLALGSLSGFCSAFLNNTNVTGLLLPATVGLAKVSGVHASRMLIPLAYASILGGTCTLIGTSTNIAASGLMRHLGMAPFSVFEFTGVGVAIAVSGILFLSFLGHRLLPDRSGEREDADALREYLSSVVIQKDSPLIEHTLSELSLTDRGLTVVAVHRGGRSIYPDADTHLKEGDLLILSADRTALLEAKADPHLHLEAEVGAELDLGEGTFKLKEAIVMPRSELVGRTLRSLRFRQRFALTALALHRRGAKPVADLRDLPLAVGDVLLLQGTDEAFARIRETQELWPLGDLDHVPFRQRKGLAALGTLALAVLAGALGWLPLSIGLLIAAGVVVAVGATPGEEVYRAIDWRLLILIGGMISVGTAMQDTGTADWIAEGIVRFALPFGVGTVLAVFAVLTILLTQPLSNAAAVLVVLPVALSTAQQLGVNPRTFAVVVTLSASLSFITPLEPSCLLVYGPGRYRFVDFVRAGVPLTILTVALVLILVPRVWPL